jgi:sec-independent protein translocase protein TatA
MGALKPWHIAVLVVVLVLLFGAKRLPDAARSLGRSLRIIKAETKHLTDDDERDLAEKSDAQHGRSSSRPRRRSSTRCSAPATFPDPRRSPWRSPSCGAVRAISSAPLTAR